MPDKIKVWVITGYKEGVGGQPDGQGTKMLRGRAVGIALAASVAAFWMWAWLTGSVPGDSGRAAREQAEGREQGPTQTQEGGRSGPKRLAAEKPDSDD